MSTPFLGEIKIFAGNFAPRGWALCNGQLLPIAQNTALFSLLGTFYGGNGTTNFALPDLRAHAPIHQGQGPGLSAYVVGEISGQNTHTLTANEVATHSHAFDASAASGRGATGTVTNNAPNQTSLVHPYSTAAANATMSGAMIQPTPASQPHENRQPLLGLNFIIATQGIFPSRN